MKSHKSDKIHAMAWIFFLQVLALFRAARLTTNNVVKPDAGTTAVPTLNKHSRLWIYTRQQSRRLTLSKPPSYLSASPCLQLT